VLPIAAAPHCGKRPRTFQQRDGATGLG